MEELDFTKTMERKEKVDFNTTIQQDDRILLDLPRINNSSVIDWGKLVSISNQFIGKEIFNKVLPDGFKAYTTDDEDCPEIDTKNNSPGFDIVIQSPNGNLKRVQAKLRQVKGVTPFSTQVGIETTRRNSKKNENKNHTGHVCYSCDEFDYVLVSLVHIKDGLHGRNDLNKWKFSLIPVEELVDTVKECCVSSIKPGLLSKYEVFN
jgi:hypothetical protein